MKSKFFLNGITLPQLAEALAPLLQKNVEECQQETKDFIRREEACSILHCSYTTLYKHTKSGRLKSYGIGNRVLYKKSEVLEAVKPINH